jgi:serine/threonine protein kinase/Flp pilus assembly protein TadD
MPTDGAAAAPPSSGLVDRLAEDLARRWRAGERPAVEDYLARYPELLDRPEAAVELIYEELCLRREDGQEGAEADVLCRFPQWRERLRVLVECQQLLEGGAAPRRFPAAGEALGNFRLLAELGRGAHGRVFLATQPALAGRPVVLKLTPRSGREHLALARLQHTHIVPLYSVQDDPARGLRALCMPYFGGATLARVLELLRPCPPGRRTGRQIVEALGQAQSGSPVPLPVEGPACQFLARASYVQAVCWVGACLADALHYAHERGLVHLDLKPSNVLWGADGQPMLLDLHLARGPLPAGAPAPAWLGGTPAYMAPEHRLAVAAVQAGQSVPAAVDGRADVYALGLLLCEALAGSPPPPGPAAAPWLRRRNPHVTAGLGDILGKCLETDPRGRYAGAAALADDLRRHLADLPLRGVANRSPDERWRKWRRRKPYGPALLALLLAVLAGAGLVLMYLGREARVARAALEEGRQHLQGRAYGPARAASARGLAVAEGLPLGGGLAEQLRAQLRRAESAESAQELHVFVDRVRTLYGADGQPSGELGAVEAHCRAFWERREVIARRLGAAPAPEREQVQNDLLDLAVLWTHLCVRLAGKGAGAEAREGALEVLAQAEALFGPSCVLDGERRAHAAALGRPGPAPGAAPGPRTAWEHYALGQALFRAGDLEAAAAQFDRALALQPQALWPNFDRGRCAYRRGRHEDAVLSFTACAVLAPQSAWCFYNRGLAYDALGQADRAFGDYDRALRLDPALAAAAVNRGMLHYRAGRHADALDDLRRARAVGADPALVDYDRALVHLARGDRAAARASLQKALEHDPGHEQARRLAATLRP